MSRRDDFRMPDSWYDPPEEQPERDDPLDDGDYAYDRWRDEQMEREDEDLSHYDDNFYRD